MNRAMLCLCCCASIPACGEPIRGDWKGIEDYDGFHSTMSIDADLRGYAHLIFPSGTSTYEADFDVQVMDSQGSSYVIAFDFETATDLDFDMDCEMSIDNDRLYCSAGEPWEDYDFNWERD